MNIEIAELIAEQFHVEVTGEYDACAIWATPAEVSDAIIAAGYRKPRTITTAEELDALPNMAVIIDRFGGCSNIIRNNPHFQAADYHYLLEHGPITVLYEPTA